MTLTYFFAGRILPGSPWTDAVTAWLAHARDMDGETLGLILLLATSIAVPAAVWLVVYRTLLVWLRADRDSETHR